MIISSDNTTSAPTTVAYIMEDEEAGFSTTATVNISTYKGKSTPVNFKIKSMPGFNSSATGSIIKLSNSLLDLAVSGWDILLKDKVGITMKDIGFLSYT